MRSELFSFAKPLRVPETEFDRYWPYVDNSWTSNCGSEWKDANEKGGRGVMKDVGGGSDQNQDFGACRDILCI